MLVFENVSFSAGKTEILKNLNFSVHPGEMVAVLGQSGAGKSSVFRLLIAERRPTKGHIKLDNFSLENLSFTSIQKYRRQIGTIFQDFRLLPKKTVFQNIAFALEVSGELEGISEKVQQLLTLVGMEKQAHKFPHQLSGGESQRVAIARALVHNPKIIIADEATGNLDPKNSREIAQLFKKINKEKGVTIIFSTHDPIMVLELSPRIIRLEGGAVLFDKKECSHQEAFEGML